MKIMFFEKLNSSNTFSPSRCESAGRRKDYCRKDCFRGQVVPCLLDTSVSNDILGGKGAEDVEHGGRSFREFTQYFNISGAQKAEMKKYWLTFWENNIYSRRRIGKHQKQDQGNQGGDRGKPGTHGVIKRDNRSVDCGGNGSHERVTMSLRVSYQLETDPYPYMFRYNYVNFKKLINRS